MVLYRKYRPQKFSDLVGQAHIKDALCAAIAANKLSHAYLFAGPRGIGKTTTARILAKAVNCAKRLTTNDQSRGDSSVSLSTLDIKRNFEPCDKCDSCLAVIAGTHMDLIEIDAASNRGIDDVRDLREKIRLAPTASPYKVYIIDEVHMLTTEAFNALLKTLEEPPAHAIFILATTSPEKMPPTILSRCTQFYFKKANVNDIAKAIKNIANAEKMSIDDLALNQITKAGNGSFRDALTILDALSHNKKITYDQVFSILAYSQSSQASILIEHLTGGEIKKAISQVNNLINESRDINKYFSYVIEALRAMFFIKNEAHEFIKDDFDEDTYKQLESLTKRWSTDEISFAIREFTSALQETRFSPIVQLPFELAIIAICQNKSTKDKVEMDKVDLDKDQDQETASIAKNEKVKTETKKEISAKDNVNGLKNDLKQVGNIKDQWRQILTEIKKQSISVESMLKVSKIASFDGKTLIIETPYRFHKERLESQSVYNLITQVLEKILSQKVKMKCIIVDKKLTSPPNDLVPNDLETAVAEIFVS